MCVCGGFNLDQLPFSEGTQFLLATFHAVQQIKKKKKIYYILLKLHIKGKISSISATIINDK